MCKNLYYIFSFSVPDTAKRCGLCDRPRLQPRLRVYSQSHLWGEGGELMHNLEWVFFCFLNIASFFLFLLLSPSVRSLM